VFSPLRRLQVPLLNLVLLFASWAGSPVPVSNRVWQPTPFQQIPAFLQLLPSVPADVNMLASQRILDEQEQPAALPLREGVDSEREDTALQWGVHSKVEPELYARIMEEGDGVDAVTREAEQNLAYLVQWLREEGEKALAQAEAGADPLIRMKDEVGSLLEAVAAIENEVVQLQENRVCDGLHAIVAMAF
jgi:hypothetical protein